MSIDRQQRDEQMMQRALELAEQGVGTTSPNPPVGAVIVHEGRIIGEGYHEKAGQAHAERRALQHVREQGLAHLLPGATIYVTLEPCSSYGRTPPCTDAIIESGIARVVYGADDPDKRHKGRAAGLLRAAGIEVLPGVAEGACRAFLRPWLHAVTEGYPWITAKIAATLDGRITRCRERRLSGAEALVYAHSLRAESDAILVGGCTVRSDRPALTIRCPQRPVPACKEQPWRVVLTQRRAELPGDAPLFSDANAERTLVYEDVADLKAMARELYTRYGVVRLMLECGGRLLRKFLEQGLVHEWVQVVTPYLTGGGDMLLPGDWLPSELKLDTPAVLPMGRDVVIRGMVRR